MGKDPAFLFYPADFMIGTCFFSMEERGQYISLLCYQSQAGHLSKFEMLTIIKEDSRVFTKFELDSDGKYYNKRLDFEIAKRKHWCLSRNNNKDGNNQHSKLHRENRSSDQNSLGHMTSAVRSQDQMELGHMENRKEKIENRIKNNKTTNNIPPSLEQVAAYCNERQNGVNPEKWHSYYTSNGWLVGKNKMKDWKAAVRTWESNSTTQTNSKLPNKFNAENFD